MTSNTSNGHLLADDKLRFEAPGEQWELEEEWSMDELAEIWTHRAYVLAEPPPAETQGQTLNLLVFILNGERYAIEVNHVREIYPLEQITPVPRTPDFVVGVFSARGRLVSVMDLHAFFGLPRLNLSDDSRIIVAAAGDGLRLEIGFLADDVADVLTIFQHDLEPVLTTHTGDKSAYLHGLAPGMVAVMNLDALFNSKQLIVHEEIL